MPRFGHDEDPGFRRYLQEIGRYPRLDRPAEERLARAWRRRGDRAAANALVEANLRYVVTIAAQYRGYGLRLADLVEEGNVGLIEAVRRYDPARKVRFMTYAAYWIRAYILAHVLKQSSIVGVGSGPLQSKLFFGLARQRARLVAELGEHDPDLDRALAERFRTTEDRVRRMAERLDRRDASLDAPAWRDGDATVLDLLRDESADQEERYAHAQRDARVRERLEAVWDDLDPREKLIVRERLLGDDEDAATLADLGRRLGLSRERVRQLEERVKGKLRRALEPAVPAAARAA